MKIAIDSLIFEKRYLAMTKQPNTGPSFLSRIGKGFTKLLYLELGIYLVLGAVALLVYGLRWLAGLF